MSWVKRRGHTTPSPAPVPQVPMYNPNQHSNQAQDNQWQQANLQPQNSWYPDHQQQQNQPQSNYWQPSYNHPPPAQTYSQNPQNYVQYQEHAGYQENYQQQNYDSVQFNQQYNHPNNYNQQQSTYTQPQGQQQNEGDSWNWGWGDEDNSNLQNVGNTTDGQPAVTSTENHASNDSWDWKMDDNSQHNEMKADNEMFAKVGQKVSNHRIPKLKNDVSPGKPPSAVDHLAINRGKLDTPQWSTESQISQESSDDVQQTSESDNLMLSRSSTISQSPLSGHDNIPLKEAYDTQTNNQYFYENKEIIRNENPEQDTRSPSIQHPPNTQTPPLAPPPNRTGNDDANNPYKRTTTLPHKVNRFKPSSTSLNYQPMSVNLETLPDNSEHPDSIPQQPEKNHFKSSPQWPENSEIPINDRNQYLETGQLSDADRNEFNGGADRNQQQDDALPPPGLRRMVLGQMEQSEADQNVSNSDEPPPGLSRMVLGETEPSSQTGGNRNNEPPEGLHRMVPGESSSPESSLRPQNYQSTERPQEDDSEAEFDQIASRMPQPRSATIGADTPPSNPIASQSANRSATIGADTPPIPNVGTARRTSASSNDNRSDRVNVESSRRNFIEGQPQDEEVANLATSVRNLKVDNAAERASAGNSPAEASPRRHSRQESSESDHDNRRTSPRDRKDKRNKDDRRERDRRSPDHSRSKRHDRRKHRDQRRYDSDELAYSPVDDSTYEKKYNRRGDNDDEYLSDKEKHSRHYRDDHEKRYHSLRRDKDKDRRRRDGRDYPRESKHDYYYDRYDEQYVDEHRSRPSSRSDSMRDSYRNRHDREHRDKRREKERDRHGRRPRDPYRSYGQGYGYDPYGPYYQQYQYYYENLRRTNPQAYAEWYRKYYQQTTGQAPSYTAEDRASVHSGRSSANDELAKDRYTRQSYYSQSSIPHVGGYYRESHAHSISGRYGLDDSSYVRPFDNTDSLHYDGSNATTEQRLTPAKYATAHIKASICSGRLVKIPPHYPLDGESPVVELLDLNTLNFNDDEFKELIAFPGPLIKGTTHKKTIIEYCENKIKGAVNNFDIVDAESYVLMWELLILLIRQNGMVVGTDIAELLLKNRSEVQQRPSSVLSSISSVPADGVEPGNHQLSDTVGSAASIIKEEDVTNKFREYLLYGSCKEALEWAMKHGLWGHALFLASKLDKRTYANVMMRFANGLTMNDPLQTLYQLLSGRMPAAVTCVADEKWGDWRPHLAMILSNSSQRPELNCKAITSLGDTLMARGSLYAAQFCYLMAEVGFSRYGSEGAKLVLLGSNHSMPFLHFASNEAIHMTEIYEYACSLNDSAFVLTEFQPYKYLLATRLADRGLLEKSLSYLEEIATHIIQNPSAAQPSLINNVTRLADRLKYYDPVGDGEESEFDGEMHSSRPDNSWLTDLRAIQSDVNAGSDVANESILQQPTVDQEEHIYDPSANNWQQQPQTYDTQYQDPNVQQWQPDVSEQNQFQYQPLEQQPQETQQIPQELPNDQYQNQQQPFWSNQQQWGVEQATLTGQENFNQHQNFYGAANAEIEDVPPKPQISMPNQSRGKSAFDDEPSENKTKPQQKAPTKPLSAKQEQPASTGWFGGIFSKLALKPKNQMKLPDDKNPSIVWDQEKKRWINVDEDNNETASEIKAPPKMSEMMPKLPPPAPVAGSNEVPQQMMHFNQPYVNSDTGVAPVQHTPGQLPGKMTPTDSKPPLPTNNMFKMQRSRDLKKSYVDVFNAGGKQSGPTSLPTNLGGYPAGRPAQAPQMNFFIPQPINDPNAPTDFLTPAPVRQPENNEQARQ